MKSWGWGPHDGSNAYIRRDTRELSFSLFSFSLPHGMPGIQPRLSLILIKSLAAVLGTRVSMVFKTPQVISRQSQVG